jgi:hypothetical protein
MKTPTLLALLASLALASSPAADELFVDGKAKEGGDGSAARPFSTLGAAVKAARGGETITVREGVYPEQVNFNVSGADNAPTVLRAAPGARVVISGFGAVAGWKPARDNVYTATVDWLAEDLFVGYQPQELARWPSWDKPWRRFSETDGAAGTLSAADNLSKEEALKGVAAAPASARLYAFVSTGNFISDFSIDAFNPSTGVFTTSDPAFKRVEELKKRLKGGIETFQVVNHASLIREPGQYAFEKAGDQQTKIWFWPRDKADLERTQARKLEQRLVFVGKHGTTVTNVRIEGLELAGCRGRGVEVNQAENVVVTRCIAHHNDGGGFGARRSEKVTFSRCISLANQGGIMVASSKNSRVEECEVAYNFVDGINVAGNVSGRAGAEPESEDVVVRRCYSHHHIFLSHPDNMQTYRGVKRLTIEDCVMLVGGQTLMTEETEDATLRNCVFLGAAARAIILGHGNSQRWTVERNTLGLAHYGLLGYDGTTGHSVAGNLFYGGMLPSGEGCKSDHNLVVPSEPGGRLAIQAKPKWRAFNTIEEIFSATGQDQHSRVVEDPKLAAVPASQAVAHWGGDQGLGELRLQASGKGASGAFEVGDMVEINADGVLRKVTGAPGDVIQFTPPLKRLPFRHALVWNWKKATSTAIDVRPKPGSPALTAGPNGGPVGSTLDVEAFRRGDFDGDGKRDLPELPEDVKATTPDPNAPVLGVHGS